MSAVQFHRDQLDDPCKQIVHANILLHLLEEFEDVPRSIQAYPHETSQEFPSSGGLSCREKSKTETVDLWFMQFEIFEVILSLMKLDGHNLTFSVKRRMFSV